MMTYKVWPVWALALVLFAGCKTAKAPVVEQANTAEEIVDDAYRPAIKNKELYNATTEAVLIDSANVQRDTLHIFTSKMQACDTENFKLIWDGKETISIPPKASLKLLLVNEPGCRELHRFHLKYNVSALHPKQSALAVTADTMLLQLARVKQPIKYTY